jgi:hypothetical protein
MMDEPELKELLKTMREEYDEVTLEILEKCSLKEDYINEFIEQNRLYAQIKLVQHILDSNSKSILVEKAKHN